MYIGRILISKGFEKLSLRKSVIRYWNNIKKLKIFALLGLSRRRFGTTYLEVISNQEVLGLPDCLTLQDGTDRLSRSVAK